MRTGLVLLVVLATSAIAAPHKKAKPVIKHAVARFQNPDDAADTPAVHYAAMAPDDCLAELDKRKIDYQKETAKGVLAPVRLAGPLHGVLFRTDLNEDQRATTPWEIADCRLVLALDDFAQILEKHDVVEVRHYSIYRPPPKSASDSGSDKEGTRHEGAMAIDAAHFIDKTGKSLDVVKHFHGAIGAKTCGEGAAPDPATAEATELRAILCDAVAAHLFNVVLTPNYNKPHHNHFHLEVTKDVKWFLVH